MNQTLAWHGDADLKATTVERMKKHRDADEIIQGLYQSKDSSAPSGYRGCFIGCTLPRYVKDDAEWLYDWHQRVADLYAIPLGIAFTAESIFELLDEEDAPQFALDVLEAIPAGADLSEVDAQGMMCAFEEDDNEPTAVCAKRFLDALRCAPVPPSVA